MARPVVGKETMKISEEDIDRAIELSKKSVEEILEELGKAAYSLEKQDK